MQVTYRHISLEQFDGDKDGPRLVLPAEKLEKWFVLSRPIRPGEPIQYMSVTGGDGVLARLMRVRCAAAPSSIASWFLSIGAQLAAQVAADKLLITKLTVITGVIDGEILEPTAPCVIWLGLAFQAEEL